MTQAIEQNPGDLDLLVDELAGQAVLGAVQLEIQTVEVANDAIRLAEANLAGRGIGRRSTGGLMPT